MMSDELPPIAPGALRVIVYDKDADQRMTAEYPVEHLSKILDSLSDPKQAPMTKRIAEGAIMARAAYRLAMKSDKNLTTCACAVWICLYGDSLPLGLGMSLDDLSESPGTGTLQITTTENNFTWDFVLTYMNGDIGGRVVIREPKWSTNPAGSA